MTSTRSASRSLLRGLLRPAWRGLIVALSLAAMGGPSRAAAQNASPPSPACGAGTLSRVEIRNHSLFAPEELRERSFSWALGTVNRVHIRTRSDYVRNELLVAEGECYDPDALDASVRNLRDLDFIARAEAQSWRMQDSTWAVRVETWDEWSTQVGVDFDVENEIQFKGFNIAEKNALGRGLRASFRYRSFRERNDKSFTLATKRFLGTRAQALVAAGTTRTGSFLRQDLNQPFVSEASRFQYLSRIQYEDREHAYLTGNRQGITHVLLPLTDRTAVVRSERRFGVPGSLFMVGAELDVLRRTVSGPVRQVVSRDFRDATTAPDSLVERLGRYAAPDSRARLGVAFGLRRLTFTTATGLDLISGVQNVALGSELVVTVGRTFATWGTSSAASYGRVEGFVAGASGPWIANAAVTAEGVRLDSYAGASRLRDLQLRGRALLYLQPPSVPAYTLAAGVRFNLRRNNDQPWQLALGGEEGVRGYRDDELPTSSTVVAFAEERINLPWFRPAVDLGLIAFGDLGRGWAADTPFGLDTGWRAAVGGGIRIGFPAGTGTVTRIELGWPIGPSAQGRGPVLRTFWSPVQTRR